MTATTESGRFIELCAEMVAAMYRMNDPKIIAMAKELQDDPEYCDVLRRYLK